MVPEPLTNAAVTGDPSSSPPGDWRLPDLIDFEFFLDLDRGEEPESLEARDRAFYASRSDRSNVSAEASGQVDRRKLFRAWLEMRRREQGSESPLPGEIAAQARRLLGQLAIVVGLTSGSSAATSLLRYDGVQPINVATYFGWLVVLPVLLTLAALGSFLLRRWHTLPAELGFFLALAGRCWSALTSRLGQTLLVRVPAAHRESWQALLGNLGSRRSLYGAVLVWPMAGLLQRFGVSFHSGVLAATLALVVFSDRAFGWQSAIDVTAEQVHALISLLAAPWSWLFAAGTATPTVEQIEGSRIILKSGIRQLATQNLVSWWPFLVLSVATYGWLPRLLLLLGSAGFERRELRTLTFQHAACDRLLERMITRRLASQGRGVEQPRHDLPDEAARLEPLSSVGEDGNALEADRVFVLAEADLLRGIEDDALDRALTARFRLRPYRTLPTGLHSSALQQPLREIGRCRWLDGHARVVIVAEAWEPPIAETMLGLRLVRATLGPDAKIVLALVGRPRGRDFLTPACEQDSVNWERRIAALADPGIRVESLVRHA